MARAAARSAPPRDLDAFLRWHETQPERWEFVGGAAVMMAPASRPHTMLKGNIYAALRAALEGSPCTVYSDGIEIREAGQSAIPDVVVSCREPDLESSVEPEPILIIEVVSASTAHRDRVEKWASYRRIHSLVHYMLVEQDRRLVELHTRQSAFVFEERFIEAGDVPLGAIGVTLALGTIYRGVIDG